METIDDVIDKKMSKSLFKFKGLVDPENKHGFDTPLIEAWNALTLSEQRKLYLYLLYRKWRGIDIYGDPYFIIKNCHPVPFNWNGYVGINRLAKQGKLVIAKHQGKFGAYTRDEAMVYEMTDITYL